MENRRSIAIRAQVVQQPAVSPTKEALFGSGKKAGASRTHTRKALADKTNESPTSGFTPPMLKEGERVSYKGTPYPKTHDVRKGTLSVEQVSRNQVHPTFLHKVETAEYSLYRVPKTPGVLAVPTSANTPINIPFGFSHSAVTTPCFNFAAPVFEDKPDVTTMSPDQEDALNPNNKAPASTPISVSSSFDHSAPARPCLTIAPAVFDKKTDVTPLPHQEDLNTDDKTNGALAAESSVQCMENRQCEDTAEDGELLPLDLQLLYMFGKAAVHVPSLPGSDDDDDDDDESCMTEPGALDINVLRHVEKVLQKLEPNPSSSTERRDGSEGVLSTSSAWVGRDVEDVGKCVDDDDDDDEDDDASECSVVVNVSSPRMAENPDAPPSNNCFKTDNGRDPSSLLLQQRDSSSKKVKIDEEGYEDSDYYEEENDYEEYEDARELDGACDELRNAISRFTINEKDGAGLPISSGQHVRFNYNSDDEMEGEVVVNAEPPRQGPESPTLLHLKGLPTPKGKHLRFTEDISSPSV